MLSCVRAAANRMIHEPWNNRQLRTRVCYDERFARQITTADCGYKQKIKIGPFAVSPYTCVNTLSEHGTHRAYAVNKIRKENVKLTV